VVLRLYKYKNRLTHQRFLSCDAGGSEGHCNDSSRDRINRQRIQLLLLRFTIGHTFIKVHQYLIGTFLSGQLILQKMDKNGICVAIMALNVMITVMVICF